MDTDPQNQDPSLEDPAAIEPAQPGPADEEPTGRSPWLIVGGVILIVLLLMVIGYLLYQAFAPAPAPPAPTEDSLARIQAAGVMRVGTSADYPPFEYYNDRRELDGFDVALIRELGGQLGVAVEINDFAFDGLGAALQVGQVDALIAALSITEDREQLADFTNVYYVGTDGILAQTEADIGSITDVTQMAPYRIGVQKNTVFQDWIQTSLIDSGRMPADRLFVYAKPEHAVSDLVLDRLDLVAMDLRPAEVAVSEAEVKLVGSGLNELRFAIAVPPGWDSFREELNRALTELYNNGTIARLSQEYLELDQEDLLPTPTPAPDTETPVPATATNTPETACVNAMEFVRDLNLDDNDLQDPPEMDPGESFSKGWRIKNSGTCTWDDKYSIDYVRGNTPVSRMQGERTFINGQVVPGGEYDMYVNMVAPGESGVFVGFWQLFDDADVAFGQTVWVAIEVPGPPATGTPEPSSTPTLPAPTDTAPAPTDTASAPTETPEPTATEVGGDLLDVQWELEKFIDPEDPENERQPIEGTDLSAFFNADGSLTGSAGCNPFSTTYEIPEPNKIAISDQITVGRALCEQSIMDQEAFYLELLVLAEEYQVENKELVLKIEDPDPEKDEMIDFLQYKEK
jgi:polar amino acid transport system substrate-binding protein